MKSNKLIIITFCLLFISHLYAAKPSNVTQFINHKDWNFVENKGQLSSSDIKYYGHQDGLYLYCKPGMISFVFTKTEKNNDDPISEATGVLRPRKQRSPLSALHSPVSTSRTDLVLINGDPSAQIIATNQQKYYENFYNTSDADHGITNVTTYKTISYKSIYPHIDMVLNCKEQGMEYSFIVHPGGKVADIQLQWRGIEKIKRLKDFGIEYSFDLGKIEESAPKSFAEGKVVPSRFIKNGFNYGFRVGNYDKNDDLIIDPTLLWGTYFGGAGTDQASAVTTDIQGNVFITGSTLSASGISTKGSYKPSYSNGGDVFLAKFDSKGAIQWATYYGGSGDEVGNSIVTDSSGNIYITGETESPSGIATKGSYQSSLDGGQDAFLSKFSTNGTLLWATYYGRGSSYGSPGYNIGYGVATDGAGSIYITGETESDSIMMTSGAYQTYLAGSENAFLAKFNSVGNIKWATYYGGEAIDKSNGIATDKSGNVYITGYATSTSGIATSGAYLTTIRTTSFGTNPYAFLAKFDSSGNREWATYYGNRNEVGNSVATDGSGNVYITGITESDSNIATSGAYQTSFGGSFLAKFSSKGSVAWATYFGGNETESYSVCTDALGNIYISGYTNDKNGIATSGGYQSSIVGLNDAFLAKFNTLGAEIWGTYYGGDLYSLAYGVCADASGSIYITGITTNNSGIATYGAYKTAFSGGTNDAFLAKFGFLHNDAGIADIPGPAKTFCSDTQKVIVKLKNYGSNSLTKANIQWSVNNKPQTPYSWSGHLITDSSALVSLGTFNFTPGDDTIRAWTSNPNGLKDSAPSNDSFSISVNIHSNPKAITGPTRIICKGTELSFGASPDSETTYSWTSFPKGFTSTLSYNLTIVDSSIIYICTETNSFGCSKTDSLTISVVPRPNAHWTMNYRGDSAIFHAIDSTYPSSDYSWNFGDSTLIKHGYLISHLFPKNKSYNVTLQVLTNCIAIFDSALNVTKSDIKSELNDYQLNLFPNPFSESTTLQYTLCNYSRVNIALFDITGKQIESLQNNTLPRGEYSLTIDAEKYHLYPGIYLLKFMTDDGYISKQIVKF